LVNELLAHDFYKLVVLGFLDQFAILIKVLVKISDCFLGASVHMITFFSINKRPMATDVNIVLVVIKLFVSGLLLGGA